MERLLSVPIPFLPSVLQQLRGLVAMNENLKKQEQQFKAHCKDEKARLEEAIARLSTMEGVVGEEEGERVAAIRQAFQADKDKLTKIKTLLVNICAISLLALKLQLFSLGS